MMTYTILRIEEPDFGCEGRPEGQAIFDEVILQSPSGEEFRIQEKDATLYERNLNEGDFVTYSLEQGLQKAQ